MKTVLLLLFLSITIAHKYVAHKSQRDCSLRECEAHTWNNIISESGVWSGQLASIYEKSYFVTPNCHKFNHLTISSNLTYGFIYADNANFNLAYTLTLVSDNPQPLMSSKACIFIITAFKPADPDIKALSYHGASCTYKPKEDGTIYYVR